MALLERQAMFLKVNNFLLLLILRIFSFECSVGNPSELAFVSGFSSHPFLSPWMILLPAGEGDMAKPTHSKILFKTEQPPYTNIPEHLV